MRAMAKRVNTPAPSSARRKKKRIGIAEAFAQALIAELGPERVKAIDDAIAKSLGALLELAKQVDVAILDGALLRHRILRVADEALEDAGIAGADAEMLLDLRTGFIKSFDRLMNDEALEATVRWAALSSIDRAFAIGLFGLQGHAAKEVRDELQKERTRAARQARRAGAVQEIVEEEARALWGRNPQKRGKYAETASIIRSIVMGRVAELDKVPRGWAAPDSHDEREQKRQQALQVERIRKRLERISGADN